MNNILCREAFYEEIAEKLRGRFEHSEAVALRTVTKNNGIEMTAVVLGTGERIRPTVYLDGYYEEYENGRSLEEMADEILRIYEQNRLPDDGMMDFFGQFDSVKKGICFRLVNRKRNREMLEEVPHRDLLDLSMVFYYLIEEGALHSGSILIKKEHLKQWGITEEELWAVAMQNTPQILPVECVSIMKVFEEMYADGEVPQELTYPAGGLYEKTIPLYVLTNKRRLCGAASILYENLKEFLPTPESNYYVLPSSIHELLLIPVSECENPGELKAMVRQVNATEVAPWEILSDEVYYYDGERGEVRLLEETVAS